VAGLAGVAELTDLAGELERGETEDAENHDPECRRQGRPPPGTRPRA
jgi:hypothetical protein